MRKKVNQSKNYIIVIKSWYICIIQQLLLIKNKNQIYLSKFLEFNSFLSSTIKTSIILLYKFV